MFSKADLKPCRRCHRTVRWTTSEAGRPFAVDPDPSEQGNTAVIRDVRGTLRSRRISADRPPIPGERLMMPHAATCTPPAPRTLHPRAPLHDAHSPAQGASTRSSESPPRRAVRRSAPPTAASPAPTTPTSTPTRPPNTASRPSPRRTPSCPTPPPAGPTTSPAAHPGPDRRPTR